MSDIGWVRDAGLTCNKEGPMCPHCRRQNHPPGIYEGGLVQILCANSACERTFEARGYTEISWNSWRQGDPEL